ncbi:hypothetical protein MKW98_005033 [Papaver atlanticum]|uniref:WRKY domain-containing protein n=1 Tax=Papaver atlanticum TaxID=357466 RepID=A0AAD4XVP1_9MAGN|nr:hypothetical protein MKW98_005033 [Papaver atlanticum]
MVKELYKCTTIFNPFKLITRILSRSSCLSQLKHISPTSFTKLENNTRSMSYLDQKPLILNELTQAIKLLKQLESQLESDLDAATSTNGHLLVPIILSTFEKSLSMLSGIKPETVGDPQTTGSTESPCSVNGTRSPRSDCDYDLSGNSYKKRKTVPRWTEQVRVCEQTGLEGPIEDGYTWRKYGQKDILGTRHPRCYYKCAYKNAQDCLAMKQVQRSDEDTSIFNVTYRGKHTCTEAEHLLPWKSENSPDQKNENRLKKSQGTIINFQTGCHGKTEDFNTTQAVLRSPSFSFPSSSIPIPCIEKKSHNNNDNNILSSMTPDNHFMSSPFSSPPTSESNSFSPYRVQDLQTLDFDPFGFTSTVTSAFDSTDLYFELGFIDGL